MSNIVVSYDKVKSYDMPEDSWDDADKWFEYISNSISNINNYNKANQKCGITIKRGCETGDNLYNALVSRIQNKNTIEGDYGHGKVFKDIIGEYIVNIDDKTVIDKKINTLNAMLNIFNIDEQLIYYDPAEEEKKESKLIEEVDVTKLDLENEVRLAVLISFNSAKGKVKAGQVIGRLVNRFPELMKARAKEVGPLVGKGIGMIGNEIKKLGDEGAKQILEKEYPDYLKYMDKEVTGPVRLAEPLQFYFGGGNLKPEAIYYDIEDEQYAIPLTVLIKKMKHDKAAYQELNLLKPGGGKWPQAGGGQFYMVLSNDPFMNMCKSTTRYWGGSSCENYSPSGNYPQGPVSDTWFGNLIVYIFKGDRTCEGWPYKQSVGSGWQNKIDSAPVGTLLSRQNVKWGFKDGVKGDVGGGIDPGHYPSNGRKGYQANSNRAIAMILAEKGLFNYTKLRTPYYYKGHCDVGSGTGNLTYTSGTSCFTKIDQMNFNPDLIVAENPNISYFDFNRLTKPATDRKVKLLLAKNHTIWAIPENSKGINRLLQTNDKEIISLMMASPIASEYAMNYVLDNLEFIEKDAENYATINNNICKVISRHPNSTSKIHTKLISAHPPFTNGLTAKQVFYNFPNLLWVGETHISMLSKEILGKEVSKCLNRKLLDISELLSSTETKFNHPLFSKFSNELVLGNDGFRTERKLDIIITSYFVSNMIFAKNLTIADFTKLLVKFKNALNSWNTISEYHDKYPLISDLVSSTAKQVGYSICIPLYDSKHYGWYIKDDRFNYNFAKNHIIKKDRQSVGVINNIYQIFPEIFKSGVILEYIRNDKFYNKLWKDRDKYDIDPYYFTLNSRSSTNHVEQDIAIYWDESILDYAVANTKKPIRAFLHTFLPYDVALCKPRERIHSRLLNEILTNDKYLEDLGLETVSKWLVGDLKYFKKFEDKVLKIALRDLYDSGNFIEPPKDFSILYQNVENIGMLNTIAAGFKDIGGLCRNKNIPYYIQDCLLNKWPSISQKYDGNYDEYLSVIQFELSKNPATHKDILEKLFSNKKYWKNIALNPSTSPKMLTKLYRDHPVEVLSNPSLSNNLFKNLWRLTNNVLRKEVDINVNRLNELLKRPNDKISGVKRRKEILAYMNASQNWIGYWRGGNTKKGKFAPYMSNNYYSEGIADEPIVDLLQNKKIIMLKFWDDKELHLKNELWEIKSLERSGRYHVNIDAEKHTGRESENIVGKIKINDLFSYIVPSKRGRDKKTKDAEGNEVVIKADRWKYDNIFVFTDTKLTEKQDPIPTWRYSWDSQSLRDITKAYVKRNDISGIMKLIKDWKLPNTIKSGMVAKDKWAIMNQDLIISIIDEENLWNTELVGMCMGSLLANDSRNYTINCKNLPLTKTLLEICISDNQEELDKFKLTDGVNPIKLKDLNAARMKILGESNVPIKFVYYMLNNADDKNLKATAQRVKNERLSEYAEYYTIMNPPPELIRR